MNIPFIKMHAQGNDFIIINKTTLNFTEPSLPELAKEICRLHFGMGADGLVVLDQNIPEMLIFNADGSRAEMCGSALRCCCSLLAIQTGKRDFEIKTDSGLFYCSTDKDNPNYVTAQVGSARMVDSCITIKGQTGDFVSVGNPHFVIFREDLSNQPHIKYGYEISTDPIFTEGVNVEFVKVRSASEIDLLVWERGVGATLACGTGATAAVFSGQSRGLLAEKVRVNLPGGLIDIELENGIYSLSGLTEYVADGVFRWRI